MAVEAGEANAKVAEQRCARTRRFISRVDAHLPTLADDECRRVFLDSQLDGWERRYARFVATEGASEPITDPAEPPQAADFLLTLGELAKRRSAIPTMAREPNMKDANAQNRLDSAIRSLLVAADQRCPTIIGQAHLLYHARETMRFDPERALIQLKSDAQDLCNAIADAEVAMKTQSRDGSSPPAHNRTRRMCCPNCPNCPTVDVVRRSSAIGTTDRMLERMLRKRATVIYGFSVFRPVILQALAAFGLLSTGFFRFHLLFTGVPCFALRRIPIYATVPRSRGLGTGTRDGLYRTNGLAF